MIYVHGGGWQIGHRRRVHAKPRLFGRLGFLFVSVGYRKVPDVRVEDQLADIDAAIGWVAGAAARFGGDPGNISLMGHSAGAHLVAQAAVAPGPRARALLRRGALKAVISNDTRAYDIPRIAAESPAGRLPKLYANVFGPDPARWKALSPIYHAGRAPLPDFLLLYSGAGRGGTRASFAADFAAALGGRGGRAELFDGRRYSHSQINRLMGARNDITDAVTGFLGRATG